MEVSEDRKALLLEYEAAQTAVKRVAGEVRSAETILANAKYSLTSARERFTKAESLLAAEVAKALLPVVHAEASKVLEDVPALTEERWADGKTVDPANRTYAPVEAAEDEL